MIFNYNEKTDFYLIIFHERLYRTNDLFSFWFSKTKCIQIFNISYLAVEPQVMMIY